MAPEAHFLRRRDDELKQMTWQLKIGAAHVSPESERLLSRGSRFAYSSFAMPEIRHLSRAPIVEAVINFQANAARLWNPDAVRAGLSARWPEHTSIQMLTPIQIEMTQTPEGQLPPKIMSDTQGFVFRSPTCSNLVHQARRDGYAFSWLTPYKDWESLEVGARAGWAEYQAILEPEELHSVAARFINHLQFPPDGFKLARYFTTPPAVPPGLDWQFYGFTQQNLYAVPNSPCVVNAVLLRAFDLAAPEALRFILDISISLKEPFAVVGRELDTILAEMHDLKNLAFFNLLTEEAIQLYK
jgi:uncharacterized protein (TIGR04255 family)